MHQPRSKRGVKQSAAARAKKPFTNRDTRVVLYNSLPAMPDEFDTKVRSFGAIISAGATASINLTVFTNSLLHGTDDIPAISTDSPLNTIGRNYTKYRVVSYRIDYVLVPRSSSVDTNVTVFHSPSANPYGSGSSWVPASVSRDKSKFHLVPRNTSSPCIVNASSGYSLLALVGNPEYEQDDKYAGTLDSSGNATSPTELTYANLTMGQSSGGSFTAGSAPVWNVTLTQYVRFYDKRL